MVPEIERLVVDAPPFKKVVPVNVEDACEMRPLWKVLSALQMLVVVVENAMASVLLVSVRPLPMVSAPVIPVAPVERMEF